MCDDDGDDDGDDDDDDDDNAVVFGSFQTWMQVDGWEQGSLKGFPWICTNLYFSSICFICSKDRECYLNVAAKIHENFSGVHSQLYLVWNIKWMKEL